MTIGGLQQPVNEAQLFFDSRRHDERTAMPLASIGRIGGDTGNFTVLTVRYLSSWS